MRGMKAPNGAIKKWLDDVAITWNKDKCLIFPFALNNYGYGQFHKDRKIAAHSYVCAFAHGPRPKGMWVAHSCGNPACVNKRHLRWDTPAGNAADKLLHGTHNRGERCGTSRLTERDVLSIRNKIQMGRSQGELADEYGMSQSLISLIKNGKRWGWL
jgi:HNH endonuclease